MISFFSYSDKFPFFYLIIFAFFFVAFSVRTLPTFSESESSINESDNVTWHNFARLIDTAKGSHVQGISELKQYFHRFGYLINSERNFTNKFDEKFEADIILYQKSMGLNESGKLDFDTVTEIMSPRCGVSENFNKRIHVTKHYTYFSGEPRWARPAPLLLTYAFIPGYIIDYIEFTVIKQVFKKSFSRWSDVIPVNFTEVSYYDWPDIKIGFYNGDHGDGEPFDGTLGILAHAFSPENGRFHMDSGEIWAVDFDIEKSKFAVDMESVVTHEIGHILGLGHTSVKQAVMYPSLKPRTKKVDLKSDDVVGIQSLYGSNPNFNDSALLEADTSSGWVIGICKWDYFWVLVHFVVFVWSS